jgi:hypothetical protein
MGSDRVYQQKVERCLQPHYVPVTYNAAYADLYNYSLRFYIDEDVPYIASHPKNAMMGELRKVFALADAMRPTGPKFGVWKTQAKHIQPDLVMWVDGDAHSKFNELLHVCCSHEHLLKDSDFSTTLPQFRGLHTPNLKTCYQLKK